MNKQISNGQTHGNHDNTQVEKATVVLLANPSDVARTLHAFEYAVDLNKNGIPTKMFLDGEGVKIVEKEPHEFIKPLYEHVLQEGILQQACNFCANIFGMKDKLQKANIPLSTGPGHVSIGRLVREGNAVLVV
jgi:hypothetical protein